MVNKSVDELCEKLDGKIDVLVINAGTHDSATVLEGAQPPPLNLPLRCRNNAATRGVPETFWHLPGVFWLQVIRTNGTRCSN